MCKLINLLTVLFLATTISLSAKEKQQPNILLIAVDDLNDWVGAFGGNPQMLTPHMDKLASKAMVFRNASCPGPVCGPSRSALLSGFMPYTTGLYGNSNNMLESKLVQENYTLPEYFSNNGYVTISKGKIFHKHSTSAGVDHGHWAFDIWEQEKGGGGIQEEKFYSRNKGIIDGKKLENPKYNKGGGSAFEFGPTKEGKEITKDYLTALWFEKKLQDDYDKPFFMSVGISKPHLPFVVPQEYFDMYSLDTIKVPEYRLDDLEDIVDPNGKKAFSPQEDFLWCEHYNIHKETVRAYMAACTYADECVGVVLDALAKSKYAENTIVVLWGDHGWHLGEKLRFRKATLWRESTQLPLIIQLPGMDKQQDCFRNVNLIDLYPTLIDLCGLPPKELDGKSIKPLLKNPNLKWEPTVTTRGRGSHSVMAEEWHYIKHNNGIEELYDLKNDPMEWNNLIRKQDKKAREALNYLIGYLPENDALEIPKSEKDKSMKFLDTTIKNRRRETIIN